MEQEKVTEELVRQNGNQAAAIMADYLPQSGGGEEELEALRKELFGTQIAEYSPDRVYNQGDYAIYQNALYICFANGTTGSWNGSNWARWYGAEVSISSNFISLRQLATTVDTMPLNLDITLGNLAQNDIPAVELQSGDGFKTTASIDVTKIGLDTRSLYRIGRVTINGLLSIDGNGKVAFENALNTSILQCASYTSVIGGATIFFGDREGQYLEITCTTSALGVTCIIEYRGINYNSAGS